VPSDLLGTGARGGWGSVCGDVLMLSSSVFEVGQEQAMISGYIMLVDYKDFKGLKLRGTVQCWVITHFLDGCVAQHELTNTSVRVPENHSV